MTDKKDGMDGRRIDGCIETLKNEISLAYDTAMAEGWTIDEIQLSIIQLSMDTYLLKKQGLEPHQRSRH